MADEKNLITSKGSSYEIIRKLGEGFAGEVFLVRDMSRNEPLALKLLNPEAFKEGQLAAFKREFMLLSDLHHPHVCRVFDFGFSENKQRYFFTLELVQGTDLYTYVANLSVDEIEEVFVQIADGLSFIHQTGLIHYDIKGGNILITNAPTGPLAKIVDFGLAAPSVEKPENIAGTIRYMSPEMITKGQAIDYRADLYSLGIMLFRMLAGRYPEQGATTKDVLSWHVNHKEIGTAALVEKGVPKYLIDVIENLTKPIPTERFSSAAVVIRFIELHSGKKYVKEQKRLVSTLMEEGPLVARDDIMQRIRPALHRLGEKKPLDEKDRQTLILKGPRGSGKTRILREAKYIAQLTELGTRLIRCEEVGQDLELFKKALGCEGKSDDEAVKAVLSEAPLCLMIDNLDRCSAKVRDFVVAFANTLYSAKFMGSPHLVYLMITMSVDSRASPLPIPMHLDVDEHFLSPFTEENVTYYMRLAIGESNPSPAQIRDIMKFSGGVPELVKIAIATLDSPTARLEGGVDRLFADQFKGLSDAARRVLGLLALSQRPLAQQQLIVLSGVIVETAVASLTKQGLVNFDRQSGTYETSTGAISTAVQKALPPDERKSISAALLEYFEKNEPNDVDALARYAELGAERDMVAKYLINAAEKKELSADMDSAYEYYLKAIGLLDKSDARLSAIHRRLAKQQILNGKLGEAISHVEAAAKIDGEKKEDLLCMSWVARIRHRPDEALKFIQKAVGLVKGDESDPEYIKLLNEEGQCHIQMGKPDEAIAVFTRTLAMTDKLSAEVAKKVPNNNLGMAEALKGNYGKAIEFYTKKKELFSDDRHHLASVLSQLGYVYQKAGFLTESLAAFKESWEGYSEIGDTHSAMTILGNIVSICQSKALFTDALPYVTQSIDMATRSGSEKDLASNFLTLGTLHLSLGLDDVAGRYLNEAAAIFQKIKDSYMEGWVQLSLSFMYKDLGRYDEALAYLDILIKRSREMNFADLVLWSNHEAADMLLDLGDPAKAARYIGEIKGAWPGAEKADETAIKIELIRCRHRLAEGGDLGDDLEKRLLELTELSEKMELRELHVENCHTLSTFYGKKGDEKKSASYVAKARDIIVDIAASLSEEYRASYLKQRLRSKVIEDSVRLKDIISEISMEEGAAEEASMREEAEKAPPRAPAAADQEVPDLSGGKGVSAETSMLAGETSQLASDRARPTDTVMIGQSDPIVKIKGMVDRLKDSHVPVLICGPAGSGKDAIAYLIHSSGKLAQKQFVKLDLSAYTDEYIRNVLWGVEDASVFESIGDGTLFIAAIENASEAVQKDLAKAIEKKTFKRASDGKKIAVTARLIAGSNLTRQEFGKKVAKDLAKIFSEVVVEIPPLAKRRMDIPLLIDYFIKKVSREKGLGEFTVDPRAISILMQHSWPGDVSELEQVIQGICTLYKSGTITEEHVRAFIG